MHLTESTMFAMLWALFLPIGLCLTNSFLHSISVSNILLKSLSNPVKSSKNLIMMD